MNRLIRNEAARWQPASSRKKLFHISSFMYFAFIFLELITITSFEEALKVCEQNFFRETLAKGNDTCKLPGQLRFI